MPVSGKPGRTTCTSDSTGRAVEHYRAQENAEKLMFYLRSSAFICGLKLY
jgi:hypothetical protein